MPKPQYSYDSRCEELAEHFEDRSTPFTGEEKRELAQTIQDAVEDWFSGREAQSLPSNENTV